MTLPALPPQASTAMSAVNGPRFVADLRALSRFGGRDDGGVSREALTDTECQARQWLVQQLQGAQYQWRVDDAANLWVRRAGRDENLAPVMTGSHIDTQPVGGWLDGAYGVMAGLEVLRALDDAGLSTRRPIEVMAWTNEEGSRFGPGAMGSSAFADATRLPTFLAAKSPQGDAFATERDKALAATPSAVHHPLGHAVHAYVEAHIEQGPVLEDGGQRLGVVTFIQGVRWFDITVHGSSAHAGTTPMGVRQDALLAAASLVHRLHAAAMARQDPDLRWTVGRFEVSPGSVNTVADRVRFTVDLRHPQEAVLDAMEATLRTALVADAGACRCDCRDLMRRAPTPFDPRVLGVLEAAAQLTGEPYRQLGSGAFHDAMYLADVCPAAMLFVPSHRGISHNAAEDTPEADLIAGVRALAATLFTLADAN
ncbi:M20 family metallo-hydrolase [Hydrogenophaga sp.]|uniref:M20 family metallo-hydrolase n=1 Tax=Hydrogenophaga sp. TaxID=1904254 RepID=UPI0035B31F0A